MSTYSNSIVQAVALHVAQAEAALADATERRDTSQREAANLRARLSAAHARIRAHRATGTARDLTEKEAAELNLAVLDAADLERMALEAEQRGQGQATPIEPLRTALESARRELSQAMAAQRRDELLAQARTLETQLCDRLNEAFAAARDAAPGVRFVSVWQPSDGLRRAAVHHQPPATGSFS